MGSHAPTEGGPLWSSYNGGRAATRAVPHSPPLLREVKAGEGGVKAVRASCLPSAGRSCRLWLTLPGAAETPTTPMRRRHQPPTWTSLPCCSTGHCAKFGQRRAQRRQRRNIGVVRVAAVPGNTTVVTDGMVGQKKRNMERVQH